MWRKHLIRIALPVIILAGALAGGVFAYKRGLTSKKNSAALNSAAMPPAPIVAGVVAQHDVPIYLTGVGTVIAFNTDIVRAQIQVLAVEKYHTEVGDSFLE